MSRPVKTHKLGPTEMRQLQQTLEESAQARLCRCAKALLFYGPGLNVLQVAEALAVHVNTVYTYLHDYVREEIAFVQQLRCPAAPTRIIEGQVAAQGEPDSENANFA